MKMRDLAIVIVNYNSGYFLSRCVKSLYDLHLEGRTNIIVVDNNSMDGSIKLLEESVKGIRIIKNKVNIGYARANNLAIKLCREKLLLFLNPDVEVKPHNVIRTLKYLMKHSKIGIVGIKLRHPDGRWQNSYGNMPTIIKKLNESLYLSRIFKNLFNGIQEYTEYKNPQEVDWVSGAFMMVRTEAFRQVRGFDEDYFLYYEDIDLCRRLKERGWKIFYYPFAEAIHYLSVSTGNVKNFVVDHGESPYIYFRKAYGFWVLPFLWIMFFFESVVKTAVFSFMSIFKEKYKAPALRYWNVLSYSIKKAPKVVQGQAIKNIKELL